MSLIHPIFDLYCLLIKIAVFRLLYPLIHPLEPLFVPVCFLCAWSLVLMLGWSLWSAFNDGVSQAKRMHQIPCAGCVFFTNDHRLKCPVQPKSALTEDAIDCIDYRPRSSL